MTKQKLTYAELHDLIESSLGEMTEDFVPTYEWATTLLDKIGATISLQSGIKDHLEMFDDITLPNGTTVEEYIHDLLAVKAYDPHSTPFGQDVIDTKKAYHTRSADKKIELPVWEDEMRRAFNTPTTLASFTARMLQRIEDTKNEYKYEAKKKALGDKLLRDMMFREEDENGVVDHKMVDAGVPVDQIISLGKDVVIAQHDVFVDGEDMYLLTPENRFVGVTKPVDKTTSDDFILAIQKLVEDMAFTSRKYNPFGILQQAQKENLVLLIKKGSIPVMNVTSLANAFNKELLGLGIEIKVIDDFGFAGKGGVVDYVTNHYPEHVNDDLDGGANLLTSIYAVLCDNDIVKYCETRNKTVVDVNNNALRLLYTHHFGENVVTSDAVNYVAICA